jgi:hypothetical protein
MVEQGGGRPPYDADARRHEERVSTPDSNRSRRREEYYRVGTVPPFREMDAGVAEKKPQEMRQREGNLQKEIYGSF